MFQERERYLQEQIEFRQEELFEMLAQLPEGASTPPEATIGVLADLAEMQRELEFLRDGPEEPAEPDALVAAPQRPLPHLDSGAIALPEPD